MSERINDNEFLTKYRETKNVHFRNTLAIKYSYIAEIAAKRFSNKGVPYDDLYQVASLAILKAIDRFDMERNLQMSTFLTHAATGEIKNYFRDKTGLIKVGRDAKTLYQRIMLASDEIERLTGKAPTPTEIAQKLNVDVEKVLEGIEYSYAFTSLDSVVPGTDTSLYEVIEDKHDDFLSLENKDFFKSCLKHLSEIEQRVLIYRYHDELSQSEIAKKLDVSQMMVSRLERKILLRLREFV